MKTGSRRDPDSIYWRARRDDSPLSRLTPRGGRSLTSFVARCLARLSPRSARTEEFSLGFRTLVNENGVPTGPRFHLLARPKRFELLTFWFVARRSIQLSYGRILLVASLLAEREGFEPSMSF